MTMTPSQRIASDVTYAASGFTGLSGVVYAQTGMSVAEWGVIFGGVIAVATFAANLWFRWKHLKLDEARTMAAIGKKDD